MQVWKLLQAITLTFMLPLMPGPAVAGVDIVVRVAPPVIPVYAQPAIPGPGFIWTPGYWAYDDADYYWVPGTWVRPPRVGLLWTPGYWAWRDGVYAWRAGYWGPTVGYYGGINYGFGYIGTGYHGGYWNGGVFRYNSTVNNVAKINVTNVYSKTVVNTVTKKSVSYNGGPGGTTAKATSAELAAAKTNTIPATPQQRGHEKAAGFDKTNRASVNGGAPKVAALSKPAFEKGGAGAKGQGAKGQGGNKTALMNKGQMAGAGQGKRPVPRRGERPPRAQGHGGPGGHH